MNDTLSIKLPRTIVEKLEKEARRMGLTFEEYILELILHDLDPIERVKEYIEVAKNLLEQAREELGKGDIRQAAEKLWGASALAVKAYAEWRERKRLTSHGELWRYTEKLVEELGDWVRDTWMYANGMHTCFYEGWCTDKHVEEAIKRIKKLVDKVEEQIRS